MPNLLLRRLNLEHSNAGKLPSIGRSCYRTKLPTRQQNMTFLYRELRRREAKIRRLIDANKRAEKALRDLESDFARINRVNIIGEFAATLSHEITQPIACARNNAKAAENFLNMRPVNIPEAQEALACFISDLDRAGMIIDSIRAQTSKRSTKNQRFDLDAAIVEVIALTRSAGGRSIAAIHTRTSNGPLLIQADRVQLQQVVLNLILNAIEAMASMEVGERELVICTQQIESGVLVSVRDTGPGIDPANLEQVFEAYYTTKTTGVGMGLSICRSIINAHGGKLWAEVNDPRGAVFQFTLPNATNSKVDALDEA